MNNLEVCLAECDEDLLRVVPLKQADDAEILKEPVSYGSAFNKVNEFSDETEWWLAILDGSPVGYAWGRLEDDNTYQSLGIYVTPKRRGRGIATELKSKQIEFAKLLGCLSIWTRVARSNYASARVQKKCGFEELDVGAAYNIFTLDLAVQRVEVPAETAA